jgi:acetate kinase
MKVLVANLGSTSFKYRLFDMTTESQLARGGVERIGAPTSRAFVQIGDYKGELELAVPHHGIAVQACVDQLTDPQHGCLKSPSEISAIGFKAVHGGRLQGVFRIDAKVLDAMEEVNSVAPAHNPPYIAAMRQLAETAQGLPLVAAFETDFHRTIPEARQHYAIPAEWADALPIRKWGFHGASHRFIGWRTGQLLGRSDARIISCHLGGSSSLCAIQNGQSQATTMGMSPQSGLPQNNRVGDIDPFCLPLLMKHSNKSLEEVLKVLATQGGLLGLSGGLSTDIRDIETAAATGHAKAKLAIDVYVAEIRRQLGGMLVALGGADAIAFTGGIGENGKAIRTAICHGLDDLGIVLDQAKNEQTGAVETRLDATRSRVQIWVVPTNEELIVARQTMAVVQTAAT